MKQFKYPSGWNEERVKRLIAQYESQSEEEAVTEDESGLDPSRGTVMEVPVDLVPAVRELIAKRKAAARKG